ncbi:MAG: hypothetical protein ACYTGL_31220 [Planctomycetota bacterium]|jgi:hypothetical protein
MKRLTGLHNTNTLTACRRPLRGTTLTEVLMSLMIMGIGVVSIATLFPLSAQRALQATHMTNATVLRYNAEAVTQSNPAIVFDADGDGIWNARGNYVVDPLGFQEMQPLYDLLGSTSNAERTRFGNRFDIGQDGDPDNDTLSWWPPPRHPGIASLSLENARSLVTLPDTFEENTQGFPESFNLTSITLPPESVLENIDVGTDSFRVTVFDITGRFSEVRDLEDFNHNGAVDSSLGESDKNGDGILEDIVISGQTVTWTTPLPPLFDITANGIGRVVIESPRSWYSWILTVRARASGPANIDVVVYFKRGFSLDAEQVYVADLRKFDLGPNGVAGSTGDDNGNGQDDDSLDIGYPFSDDRPNNRIVVELDASLYPDADGDGNPDAPPRPALRRGGYIFDCRNAFWYRVRDFEFDDVDSDGFDEAVVILDEQIHRNNTEDIDGNGALSPRQDIDTDGDGNPDLVVPPEDRDGDGNIDRGGILIPEGVMSVFPLRTQFPVR